MIFNAGFREYLARFFSHKPCIVYLKTPLHRIDEGEVMMIPMLMGALHVFLDCVAIGCGDQAIVVPFGEIAAIRAMDEDEMTDAYPHQEEQEREPLAPNDQTMQELNAEFERMYQEYKRGSQ